MAKTSDVSTTATTKSKSERDSAPAEAAALTGAARERAAQAAESAQYTKNVGELTAFALVSSVQKMRLYRFSKHLTKIPPISGFLNFDINFT